MRKQDIKSQKDYYEWLDEELDRLYGTDIAQFEYFHIQALQGKIVCPTKEDKNGISVDGVLK
jgi:disulfide oxidoreductase YuzD